MMTISEFEDIYYDDIFYCVRHGSRNPSYAVTDMELEKALGRFATWGRVSSKQEDDNLSFTIEQMMSLIDKGFSGMFDAVQLRSLLKDIDHKNSYGDSEMFNMFHRIYSLNQSRDANDKRKGYMISSLYDNALILLSLHVERALSV